MISFLSGQNALFGGQYGKPEPMGSLGQPYSMAPKAYDAGMFGEKYSLGPLADTPTQSFDYSTLSGLLGKAGEQEQPQAPQVYRPQAASLAELLQRYRGLYGKS